MYFKARYLIPIVLMINICACKEDKMSTTKNKDVSAKEILGNPAYQAISYGGYRGLSREIQPTEDEIKEDLRLLEAIGIKVLRTYNVHYEEVENLLKTIKQLKEEDGNFEMYIMLGAWIDCKHAWTNLPPDHERESDKNEAEINKAVALANEYPDIIKIIAVGNEAMVKWAASYYVQPWVILKWVKHLQHLKKENQLPSDIWITSSDNFASWGGGDSVYHVRELEELIREVDFISMHTYPMHDTHYNPDFWGVDQSETQLSKEDQIAKAMQRARDYAVSQYHSVVEYIDSLGIDKPVHIGETGWSTHSNEHYGPTGSKATDELKAAMYYNLIRDWCDKNGVTCFYFEAFDEQWKDANNPRGSENHFGLINLKSEAKFALWNLVDEGRFDGLTRDGRPITKTYKGDKQAVLNSSALPPIKNNKLLIAE